MCWEEGKELVLNMRSGLIVTEVLTLILQSRYLSSSTRSETGCILGSDVDKAMMITDKIDIDFVSGLVFPFIRIRIPTSKQVLMCSIEVVYSTSALDLSKK